MKSTRSKAIITIVIAAIAAIGIAGAVVVYLNQQKVSSPSSTNSRPRDEGKSTKGISIGEAEKIAIDKYGGTVKEIESDHYRGREAWEVEIRDSSQGRIEVKVDKETGEILDMEKD